MTVSPLMKEEGNTLALVVEHHTSVRIFEILPTVVFTLVFGVIVVVS